jgi:hypothetical protein
MINSECGACDCGEIARTTVLYFSPIRAQPTPILHLCPDCDGFIPPRDFHGPAFLATTSWEPGQHWCMKCKAITGSANCNCND